MTITRTIEVDGITVSLSVELTYEETKQALREHLAHLDSVFLKEFLDFKHPESELLKELLAPATNPAEEADLIKSYIRRKYAADFALNEEETTDA